MYWIQMFRLKLLDFMPKNIKNMHNSLDCV